MGRADIFTSRTRHACCGLLNDQVALNDRITTVTVASIYFHFRRHLSFAWMIKDVIDSRCTKTAVSTVTFLELTNQRARGAKKREAPHQTLTIFKTSKSCQVPDLIGRGWADTGVWTVRCVSIGLHIFGRSKLSCQTNFVWQVTNRECYG